MMKTSELPIPDALQRTRALDPCASFIVQAPAGSGKTELLTQRFLMLLSHVNQPEEILAITFTKKASAEMRARIIKTLKKAATEPEPSAQHEKKTWDLARAALRQDKILDWNLLQNPNRLRIQTIDSFNASLIKFLPILSHFGAPPEITDAPTEMYRAAVQEFLTHLEEDVAWAEAIAQLLTHMDNDLRKVETLLINILSKRDQWLRYMIVENDESALRMQLEENLAAVVREALQRMQESFPAELSAETQALARFAADNLKASGVMQHDILHCFDLMEFPGTLLEHKPLWSGICELLLTKDHDWRKQCDKNMGFPAVNSTKNAQEKKLFKEMKERHAELINKLRATDCIHQAMAAFKLAPDHFYQETQWQTLWALYKVLTVVVAQLNVVFRLQGKIDYIENAQAALFALGSEDNPTDLALALDYQIKHILIDEFQDTSNSQYALIKKLTAGWQPQDGRTLFVVGDPMQSIYRFREAEVGLFIRARRQGIGHIKLEPLTLSVNFRSSATVVNWINDHFQIILPAQEDVNSGAVSYSPSLANEQEAKSDSLVKIHTLTGNENGTQADAIVDLIQHKKLDHPGESIAILVRARNHLKDIIPALKNAGITYRAIKIDALGSRAVIQDLMALTRALNHPADRVAWLAILRAPWCGLALQDLWKLAGKHAGLTLPAILQMPEVISSLSEDGKKRLERCAPIIMHKLLERQRHDLSQWIESTWLTLGGPACLPQDSDLEDVKAYFNLLDKLEREGNLDTLAAEVDKLFAAANNDADNQLQIMTIHNAKGLEFDTVILPHLEKTSRNEDKQLLLWMEKPRENLHNRLILAPVHATGANNDSIYDYIKHQHATKTDHETGRLLYVAATRAKKNLHLFLTHTVDENAEDKSVTSKGKSLLKKLLPAIQHEISAQWPLHPGAHITPKSPRFIHRLENTWINPLLEIPANPITRHQTRPGFQLAQDNPRHIGTLVHKILENMTRIGISWWQNQAPALREQYVSTRLAVAGVPAIHLNPAVHTVMTAIENTLSDARGLWILQPHSESKTEFAITAVLHGEVHPLIIDRTFVDENATRWIIDYKTSKHDGMELEKFLLNEQTEYAEKMLLYHNAMLNLDEKPIKLGLYFPLLQAWREWEIS
jgi:ATP-dependent helicase/nuclease subunit A